MIKIRTITYNLPHFMSEKNYRAIEKCAKLFSGIKYEVHTQRINCVPRKAIDHDFVCELSDFCEKNAVRWFNLPIDIWKGAAVSADDIRDMLVQNKNAFINILCAKKSVINSETVDFAAKQFLINAQADPEGLINFRFGASMNVSPNGLFFPFTYSDGATSFSIGLEIAEELNDILEAYSFGCELNTVKTLITDVLEPQLAEIERLAEQISVECDLEFAGIDFSLAPLPKDKNSVVSILRFLGVSSIEDTGALFATAFLTGLLKRFAKTHRSVGFSGVMYSLIEDRLYADINSREGFSIDRMIALSTMCGCGVDMVPIPIDSSLAAIKSVITETACISSRLSKPLGVRLLPLQSEDGSTHFTGETDFCFNTKIVPLRSESSIFFKGDYCFEI